ncbi:hypothetical protein J2Z62_000118 [Mycoplasmoides fastidiosum]|uniref:Lipoprotein n=1 Tax=Mycoplasmoides fastidiosum TaxID=92758 RepID=A0ABU0LYC2_9BACT|nr:iron ABC transporter substrate-binding protein [Mycoplasmoides fastidiosum]MDQ0513680.1 hypothetical protein [Mycoplasmoides fastidiosum]UUD37901.1 iron ABC transporter substrate-binding protein [Mycoplasmoides fastidiosum]
MKFKKKKYSLIKGSLLLLPLANLALAACGQVQNYKILSNYNGQADLLLSLQVTPDYYPYQYRENKLREYITNPAKFVLTNDNTSQVKQAFKTKVNNRFKNLLEKAEHGPSLWNNAIYTEGVVTRNDQFWTNKAAELMFMERFVLDDYKTVAAARNILPSFESLIQTNFRASRDPYTTFGPKVYEYTSEKPSEATAGTTEAKLANGLNQYATDFPNTETPDALYRYNSYMNFWDENIATNAERLNLAGFNHWVKNQPNTPQVPIFFPGNEDADKKIGQLYQKVILNQDEVKKIESFSGQTNWKINYDSLNPKTTNTTTVPQIAKKVLHHHPAFEQQATPGSSPAAEGSQRDTMVYLFQLASGLDKYTKTAAFEKNFKEDIRYEFMKSALANVSLISANLRERLAAIREYFKKINVVDTNYDPDNNNYTNTNSKVLSLVTFPPSTGGSGNATIQTISKFGFIYHDIGLKQPLPIDATQTSTTNQLNLDYNAQNGVRYAGQNQSLPEDDRGAELFNIDDNGWWWNLGKGIDDTTNLQSFNKTSDTVIITAVNQDWSTLIGQATSGSTPYVKSLASLSKTYNVSDELNRINSDEYSVHHVEYGLWNEGLRSPFSVNMVLDQLVNIYQKQFDKDFKTEAKDLYAKAMDWGSYWTDYFVDGKSYHPVDLTKTWVPLTTQPKTTSTPAATTTK